MIINFIVGIFPGFIITLPPIGSITFTITFNEMESMNDILVVCLNCVQHTKYSERKSQ
jgi:hypothetical protein